MDIWIKLLSSAAILSALAYLIGFFGNVIADQKPYLDDRRWGTELFGVFFFVNNVAFPGIIGGAIAIYAGGLGTNVWVQLSYFLLICVCGGVFLGESIALTRKVYNLEFLFANPKQEELGQFMNSFFLDASKYIPVWLPSFIFGYILTREYATQSTAWLLIFAIEVFLSLMFQAIVYSLIGVKELPKVDVFITGGKSVIRNATLIKYNDSNVRLRLGDEVTILERSRILKIIYKRDKATVPKKTL